MTEALVVHNCRHSRQIGHGVHSLYCFVTVEEFVDSAVAMSADLFVGSSVEQARQF